LLQKEITPKMVLNKTISPTDEKTATGYFLKQNPLAAFYPLENFLTL